MVDFCCINSATDFEEGERNPPDANLYDIAKDLLDFLNGFECLDDTTKQILDRCKIEKQAGHWSADVIEKALKETKIAGKKHQMHWAFVIMVQVIQSLIYDKCKQNPAQEESGVVSESPNESGFRTRKCDLGSTKKCQSQRTGNNPADSNRQDESAEALIQTQDNNHSETIYIRVPLSKIIPIVGRPVTNVRSDYKLIDGLPKTDNRVSVIRSRKSYVMSFNRQTGNADWVYEILNRNTTAINTVEAESFGYPYHKGHLAAAANHRWCREALNDTNMIDNIVPQHQTLNTGMWKRSENCCRTRATNQNINVHVYSGPLYKSVMNPPEIQGKRVPSHFFKVIIEQSEDGRVAQPRCYLFPNQDLSMPPGQENKDNVEQYRMTENITGGKRDVTIEEIQRDSGLTFIDIRQNAEALKITGTLHGEDRNTKPCTAEIQVIIYN